MSKLQLNVLPIAQTLNTQNEYRIHIGYCSHETKQLRRLNILTKNQLSDTYALVKMENVV